MNVILAAIDGSKLVIQLWYLLVIVICLVIIWWVGRLAFTYFNTPDWASRFWNLLFLLIGAFAIINFLLSLVGYPLIEWPKR